MLTFYAKDFDAVEINYTYYRVPVARTLASMAEKVPDGFSFTLKANQAMTHERTLDPGIFQDFCGALTPLQDQGKLGCVLAQFPTSFHNNDKNRAYLEEFRDRMANIPTVIEFRHRSWAEEAVFQWLSTLELGFCCVDQPQLKTLMPAIAVATSPIAYVRFHGRNAAKWWHHEQAHERYDYSYTKAELAEWVPKLQILKQQAQQVYVFANNCYKSQSVTTARQVKTLMGIETKTEPRVQLELL
jgi:uncharacterized protein YecE (DUF72 family)